MQNLFDTDGWSVWDTEPTDRVSVLDVDLGQPEWVGSAAIAQRSVPEGYNAGFQYTLKARGTAEDGWQTLVDRRAQLGCPPVLEFAPCLVRYLRLEITKPGRQQAVQVAEFRLFAPLE